MLYFLQDFSSQFSLPQLNAPIQNKPTGITFMNPRSLLITLSILLMAIFSASAAVPSSHEKGKRYSKEDLVIYNGITYKALQAVSNSQDPSTSSAWSSLDEIAGGKSKPTGQPSTPPDTSSLSSLRVPSDTNGTTSQNAKIVSVSVRGFIGVGNDKRFMGFKINSTGSVLLRGVGPSLEGFGFHANPLLAAPIMTLHRYINEDPAQGSEPVSSGDNDNYTSNANTSEISTLVSSLPPVIPLHANQAVSLTSMTKGFYTSQVEDKNGGTGIGWAGVDLADTNGSAAFTHVSTRGLVSTGEYMFGGFQIVGTGKRKLFMRTRGPSLALFGVLGVMPNPTMQLHKYKDPYGENGDPDWSSALVAENDDYTTNSSADSAEIASLSQSLYGWPVLDAKDSGLILELEPGYYTLQLISETAASDGNGWMGIDDITP